MKTMPHSMMSMTLLGLLLAWAVAAVASTGTVTHLSGTLSVKKPDGSVKLLSQKSVVTTGDALTTERDSYAQINFTDGSQMTLRPNTTLTIQLFRFKQEAPRRRGGGQAGEGVLR